MIPSITKAILQYRDLESVYLEVKQTLGKVGKHKYKQKRNEIILYIPQRPIASINYHMYKKLLEISDKSYLIEKYKLDHRIQEWDTLKKFTEWAFVNGVEDYQFLVGMDTLYGYEYKPDRVTIPEKLRNWVNNKFKPNFDGDEEEFLKLFRIEVKRIIAWKDEKQSQEFTAEEFCTNIASTGTPGSAFDPNGPRLDVYMDGVKIKVENNKFAKSAKLSVKNKLSRLFGMERQKANVSIKTEFYPKVRLIVSSDYNTTLKMRFVDTWLRKWMHGNKLSTLYQTTHDTLNMWINMASEDGWNIPIDQSAFDHHVTKEMVLIMLEEHKALIIERCENSDELVRVMDSIIFALGSGDIVWKDGDKPSLILQYMSGILSGWQWTAHFDTVANLAEFSVAKLLCKKLGIPVQETLHNAQGDDILLRFKKLNEAVAVVCAFRSMGFDIHPSKTFFSKTHNEYLRRYYSKGMVNGYPARMVNSMLWVYPGDRSDHGVKEKLSALSANWEKMAERLLIPKSRVLHLLREDYKGAKIPIAVVEAYLSTSKINGGGQWTKGLQYEINHIEELESVRISNDGDGYAQFKLRFGLYQDRELESWFNNVIGVDKAVPVLSEGIDVKILDPVVSLPFLPAPSEQEPRTIRRANFPPNVVFGKDAKFMHHVFPDIDSFTLMGRAPKSWIYDYLTGKIESPAMISPRLSAEMASLLWAQYQPSLINAMYHKKTVPNKWQRLKQYASEVFPTIVDIVLPSGLRMY